MSTEEQHLIEADRHIVESERRITQQEQRIAALEAAGEETAEGKRLLALFRSTLVELHVHRQMILDNLARG